MADEQAANEIKTASQTEEPKKEEPKKVAKKNKLDLASKLGPMVGLMRIPLLIAIVIVLAITSGLGVSKVIGGKADAKEKTETTVEKKELGKFISFDPFTVNLVGGVNYLQAAIALEIESEGGEGESELEKEIKERKPQINDAIITILSAKSIDEISETTGREKLKKEIKMAVDSLLSCGKIESVYFTTFIMQ